MCAVCTENANFIPKVGINVPKSKRKLFCARIEQLKQISVGLWPLHSFVQIICELPYINRPLDCVSLTMELFFLHSVPECSSSAQTKTKTEIAEMKFDVFRRRRSTDRHRHLRCNPSAATFIWSTHCSQRFIFLDSKLFMANNQQVLGDEMHRSAVILATFSPSAAHHFSSCMCVCVCERAFV